MIYFICLIFGILPSIIWLLFFLKEDVHPESKEMILKVFCYGIISAFLAILFELGFKVGLEKLSLSSLVFFLIQTFIGVSLIEEFLKYFVVKKIAVQDPEFDEPLDAMLYMVIAGLGFAALENFFYLIPIDQAFIISDILILSLFRFLGATFLHALCSGVVGFFLALSFYETKKRLKYIIYGLTIAVILHGFYNFSIINLSKSFNIIFVLIPGIILVGLGIFVIFAFNKLKTLKSICKIK